MPKNKSNFYEFRVRRVRRSYAAEPSRIDGPSEAAAKFRALCEGDPRELFMCASLDAKNQWMGVEIVAIGTMTSVDVHPREIFRAAIIAGAASIVIAHCHPSGSLDASVEDVSLTVRMAAAGELLGIPLLDHLIITDDSYRSIPVP